MRLKLRKEGIKVLSKPTNTGKQDGTLTSGNAG